MRTPLTARLSVAVTIVALAATAVGFAPATPADERPIPEYAANPDDAPIRPGAGMLDPGGDLADLPMTELDTYCSWNWIFHDVVERDPETGEWPEPKAYIGTAAHCTDQVGQRVATIGADDFGKVVYDSDDVGSGVDFSLIQIDADRIDETHPQMFGFDAPTGFVTSDQLAVGDVLTHHGYGLVLGQNDLTRDRYGLVVGKSDREYVAETLAQFGDSGSPFARLDDGLAVGIVSRYGFDQVPPSTDVGPLVPWILEELGKAGFKVELATIDG